MPKTNETFAYGPLSGSVMDAATLESLADVLPEGDEDAASQDRRALLGRRFAAVPAYERALFAVLGADGNPDSMREALNMVRDALKGGGRVQ
jgi:hypothetical protein